MSARSNKLRTYLYGFWVDSKQQVFFVLGNRRRRNGFWVVVLPPETIQQQVDAQGYFDLSQFRACGRTYLTEDELDDHAFEENSLYISFAAFITHLHETQTLKDLCKIFGRSLMSVSKWRNGQTIPDFNQILPQIEYLKQTVTNNILGFTPNRPASCSDQVCNIVLPTENLLMEGNL